MSLIVLQHTAVDMFDVDPNFAVSSTNRILAGSIVGINSSGYCALAGTSVQPLGIAGDSLSDEYKTTAYSAELVVSPGRVSGSSHVAGKRWTSNRVSDYFNETLGSGKMTVYIGSGRFATDQYVAANTFTPGTRLYTTAAGLFTTSSVVNKQVGYAIADATDYPSGVPGVDDPAVENSMSLGEYITVHLNIA